MGWLNRLTSIVDPIKDKIDPLDAWFQNKILGSQEAQNKTLPIIGTTAIDVFYPGAGAALRASNDASDGNWKGAAINAVGGLLGASGAFNGLGGAASGTESGLSATESLGSLSSVEPLVSTSSLAYGPQTMGVNEFGFEGLRSMSGNPMNQGFMMLPADQLGAVGGYGQSLADTTLAASQLPQISRSFGINDGVKALQKGMKASEQVKQEQEQNRRRQMEAMRQGMNMDMGGPNRQMAPFAQMAPYQGLNGGFNPRRYGANLRKPNGILG